VRLLYLSNKNYHNDIKKISRFKHSWIRLINLGLKKYFTFYRMGKILREGEVRMKLCFCRFLLAAAIVVIAIFFLGAAWAKWVIIAAGALLAIMSLFYDKCCCASKAKKAE